MAHDQYRTGAPLSHDSRGTGDAPHGRPQNSYTQSNFSKGYDRNKRQTGEGYAPGRPAPERALDDQYQPYHSSSYGDSRTRDPLPPRNSDGPRAGRSYYPDRASDAAPGGFGRPPVDDSRRPHTTPSDRYDSRNAFPPPQDSFRDARGRPSSTVHESYRSDLSPPPPRSAGGRYDDPYPYDAHHRVAPVEPRYAPASSPPRYDAPRYAEPPGNRSSYPPPRPVASDPPYSEAADRRSWSGRPPNRDMSPPPTAYYDSQRRDDYYHDYPAPDGFRRPLPPPSRDSYPRDPAPSYGYRDDFAPPPAPHSRDDPVRYNHEPAYPPPSRSDTDRPPYPPPSRRYDEYPPDAPSVYPPDASYTPAPARKWGRDGRGDASHSTAGHRQDTRGHRGFGRKHDSPRGKGFGVDHRRNSHRGRGSGNKAAQNGHHKRVRSPGPLSTAPRFSVDRRTSEEPSVPTDSRSHEGHDGLSHTQTEPSFSADDNALLKSDDVLIVGTSAASIQPSDDYLAITRENPSIVSVGGGELPRKLIILDLNGSLVLRSKHTGSQARQSVAGTGLPAPRTVHPRPYMTSFMEYLLHPENCFDVMVWSSAQPHSVGDMVDKAFGDQKGALLAIWARDRLGLTGDQYRRKVQTTKDLEKVWSALQETHPHSAQTTLLLDDSPLKAQLQPYNHLCLREYVAEMRRRDIGISLVERKNQELERLMIESGEDPQAVLTTVVESKKKRVKKNKLEGPLPTVMDDTLLAVVGILDSAQSQTNVGAWIRSGGLWRDGAGSVRLSPAEGLALLQADISRDVKLLDTEGARVRTRIGQIAARMKAKGTQVTIGSSDPPERMESTAGDTTEASSALDSGTTTGSVSSATTATAPMTDQERIKAERALRKQLKAERKLANQLKTAQESDVEEEGFRLGVPNAMDVDASAPATASAAAPSSSRAANPLKRPAEADLSPPKRSTELPGAVGSKPNATGMKPRLKWDGNKKMWIERPPSPPPKEKGKKARERERERDRASESAKATRVSPSTSAPPTSSARGSEPGESVAGAVATTPSETGSDGNAPHLPTPPVDVVLPSTPALDLMPAAASAPFDLSEPDVAPLWFDDVVTYRFWVEQGREALKRLEIEIVHGIEPQ